MIFKSKSPKQILILKSISNKPSPNRCQEPQGPRLEPKPAQTQYTKAHKKQNATVEIKTRTYPILSRLAQIFLPMMKNKAVVTWLEAATVAKMEVAVGGHWARDRHHCGNMMTIPGEALPESSAVVVE